jgi:hypothetical protein
MAFPRKGENRLHPEVNAISRSGQFHTPWISNFPDGQHTADASKPKPGLVFRETPIYSLEG